MTFILRIKTALVLFSVFILASTPGHAGSSHGIAMHGSLKYGAGFSHFGYVNPAAPKGGSLTLAHLGSFDSLNPLIVKGSPAPGLRGKIFESLMARSYDEAFSLYGLIAESVETPDDRSWVSFTIRKEARFSDGKPLTVDDVIFSHGLLKKKGRPNHRSYYSKVSKVEKIGERTVRFTFTAGGDREMPLIMGLMPVVPKHVYSGPNAVDFEKTSLVPPVGSGPYKITQVEGGKSLVYQRDKNYWGKDLAVNAGRFNFDQLRYEVFRDVNNAFLAFQKGIVDFRYEGDPGRWAKEYNFSAFRRGQVLKKTVALKIPSGMKALVFNTRKPGFQDIRVRKALAMVFDFEWLNKTLYHGLFQRTTSYFDRSELSSYAKPADSYERQLLARISGHVSPAMMDGSFRFRRTNGSGRDRIARREALKLLKAAGYSLKGTRLVDRAGKPFSFEMMAVSKGQTKLFQSYARSLKRLGISVVIRLVDSAQYQQRRKGYDFDMMQMVWYASLSPGNEQNFRWNSKIGQRPGSYNFAGVKSKAVDKAITILVGETGRQKFVSAVRALDRLLLSGHYIVPLFHEKGQRIAYHKKLEHPPVHSFWGVQLDTWWSGVN